ncbi:hypothetical protein LQ318_13830 [Aliifodinibius salicampi]|uniref:Alginate export domain-containing protein n=1 Tax=Fodinibius salicampi TaxID=1920655 RepID=A0ABT3Q1Q5_9BACT|nr:hypothetical protein [Fodinibius salicampi]MCW9713986.1 hypothetical protein [Fodinibius salicampi]
MKLLTNTEYRITNVIHFFISLIWFSIFISTLLLSIISSPVLAQDGIDTDFGGYLKELGQISVSNDLGTLRYDNVLHHRIESEFDFGKGFEVRADMRTRLLNGWTVRNSPNYTDFLDEDPGYFDLSLTWINTDQTILHSTIDRLHLSYITGPWEVHAGRQRINWGKTMVWNPNDLFNAYAYLDFDYEERPGTDAISLQYNWSYASSVDLGYRIGASIDESVIAMMFRGSLKNYDIQLVGGSYYEHLTLGAGWTGYVKSAGFKGEFSYFHPRQSFWDETGHITATIGGDYMFSNSVYLNGELLYNSGWDSAANPVAELMQPPTADDLFMAKTGYFVDASYPLTPLTNISGGIMGSFSRPLAIFIPRLTHSLSNNLDFMVLAQVLKGSVLEDFTETPNLLYFRLKWSY